MPNCPACDAPLDDETQVPGEATTCPSCGASIEVDGGELNLSSLAGGSPADVTLRVDPGSDSSLAGSSVGGSSDLSGDLSESDPLGDATLDSGFQDVDFDALESDSMAPDSTPEVETTMAIGHAGGWGDDNDEDDDDLEADFEVTEFDEDEPEEASEATSTSLDATMDLCDWMPKSAAKLTDEDDAGPSLADDVTLDLNESDSLEDPPGLAGAAGGYDLTMMVGGDAGPETPPADSADESSNDSYEATLAADSERARQDDSDDDFGSSGAGSSFTDSSIDRTESPSSMANDATMAFDSERRSSGVDTPEPLDLTGLDSGGTIPRGPLADGRASASLKPGDSLVVGDESVRLRVSTVEEPSSTTEGGVDFAIEAELGKGGMGVVLKARQKSLNRSVAIKQIKSQEATDSDRNKFVSEAVITGQLEHPNIVPVHDLGLAADGLPFYAMKAVGGDEWEKSIKENTEEENLAILIQVAQAIAFAHSNRVLHRDLKPGNVMIGSFGEVLVMDWGLAARLDDGSEIQPAGTPIYMPPETALEYLDYAKGRVVGGKKVESSRRRIPAGEYCDIYLLGALLFKIVTGRAPHRGKSTFECLRNAAKNEIVKTRRRSELLNIAYKAMATEPEERYANATDFIDALKSYQSHAQSIKIAKGASADLRDAGRLIEAGKPEATTLYALFGSAQNGYQNALDLWEGNRKAKRRLARTQRMFAETAFANGDFDLALSLLDDGSEKDAELRKSIAAAQKKRNAREAWFRTLQYATAASLLVALGFIAYSFALQRTALQLGDKITKQVVKLEETEKRARQREKEAETARDEAEKAKQEAQIQKSEAETQKAAAEENKLAAASAEADAKLAEAKAARSEEVALENEQVAQRATAEAAQKTAEAKQQSYLAAISGLKATLAEDGVYAAWNVLQRVSPEVAALGADDPAWKILTEAVEWRDEATELVAESQAAGSQPTYAAASVDGTWQAVVSPQAGGSQIAVYPAGGDKPTRTGVATAAPATTAIDPTGRYVALVGESLTVFDAVRGTPLPLQSNESAVRCVAFHPTRPELLVGRDDTSVERWSFDAGAATRLETDEQWHQTAVTAVGYSPDGQQRYSADGTGRIIVWRFAEGAWSERTAVRHTGAGSPEITAVAISDDPTGRLVYGCVDGAVYEVAGWWDGERDTSGYSDAADERLTTSHSAAVTGVAYADSAERILSAGGTTMLVRNAPLAADRVSSGKRVVKKERRYHAASVLSCVPVGTGLVLSSDDRGRVVRWRIDVEPDADTVTPDGGRGAGVAAVQLADGAAGPRIAVADRDGFIRTWDDLRQPGDAQKHFIGHADHRDLRAWRVGGPTPRIVTVAADNRACLWDEEDGLLQRTIDLGDRPIVAVDAENALLYASTDGRPLESGASAIAVRLDRETPPTPLWTEDPRVSAIYPLGGETPGGATLAVGLRDGQVYLWGPRGGRIEMVRSSARPHWRPITALHYDPPRGRLYSGDGVGLLASWDLRSGTRPDTVRLESKELAPIVKISPWTENRLLVARRRGAGLAATVLDLSLGPDSIQEIPSTGLRDLSVDPSGALVGLRRNAGADRFATWQRDKQRPSEGRWTDVAAATDRLNGIAATEAGWLGWGSGVVQWRPDRDDRRNIATRIVSRPATAILLRNEDGIATLTRPGTLDEWSRLDAPGTQRLLGFDGQLTASVVTPARDQAVLALSDAGGDTRLELWNLIDRRRLSVLASRLSGRCELLIVSDDTALAAFGDRLEALPLAGGPALTIPLPDGAGLPVSLAYSTDAIALAMDNGGAFLGNRDGRDWRLARLSREDVSSVAFTPGGDRLLLGLASGRVLLAAPGRSDDGSVFARPLLTFEGHSDPVTLLQVAKTRGGAQIVSGDAVGRVVVRSL